MALATGCGAEHVELELRAQPNDDACTVEPGEHGDACQGANCAIEHDYVIRCPGSDSVDDLQIALDDVRIWASVAIQDQGVRSFLGKGKRLESVDPLPGDGFAGQAVDGTLYRYIDHSPSYLRSKNDGWEQIEVTGLPDNYNGDGGFQIRPDSTGGLHAAFHTGEQSGAHRLASLQQDGQWTWTSMGSWDPNTFGEYVGIDEWNRGYSLIHTGDWDGGDQVLLGFSHWDQFPVGVSGELGKVANPSRPPAPATDTPIATLRQTDEGLELLSIIDGQHWSASIVPETALLTSDCPVRYNPVDGVCPDPQCTSESVGVERDAHQLARTSDGQLWGAWLETDADIEINYALTQVGASWRCLGTVDAEASGTLHLAELAVDGTTLRSLQLPFADIGLRLSNSGTSSRELGIAAYGHRVALLFPSRHHDAVTGELVMRLLVVDTRDLD